MQQQVKEKIEKRKKVEHNPRWKGYLFLLLTSLINLSSITNIRKNGDYDGVWGFALSFGCFSFVVSLLILFLDRSQFGTDCFNYTKACNGRLEGAVLLFLSIFWIIGVAYTTQVSGIAYLAMNIYFSSWLALASALYTLNEWSTEKDILSIQELTGISATLKSWYILFIASLVVCGTSLEMWFVLYDKEKKGASIGIAFGAMSAILSLGWILTHYKLLECCQQGGWAELGTAMFVACMWVVGTAIFTQNDGIASTLGGTSYTYGVNTIFGFQYNHNCTIEYVDTNGSYQMHQCSDLVKHEIPGSNLYLATWTCLLSSINLTMRWKAQQAIQLAQAQNQKAFDRSRIEESNEDEFDLDDFQDADAEL